MGQGWSGKPSSAPANWSNLSTAYAQSLPQLLNATAGGQSAADLAAARSAAATTPMYSQTALSNLQRFAPQLAAVGAGVQDIAQQGGAATQASIMGTYGGPEAQMYRAAMQQANPEYFQTLGSATNQANNLVNSINLNGLSAGERAEVERSLGQSQTATGNLGLDNATNAVSNAMNFGSALQAKRTALGNALGTATGLLSQSTTGFNPMSVMANASQGNIGTQSFTPVQNSGNQAYMMGGQALGNLTGLTQTAMGQQYNAAQRSSPMGIGESISGQVGSVCCFIFLEVTNGMLPPWVRDCRDAYYEAVPRIALGYRRMAKLLVPLMRHSSVIKKAVNKWMVKPIAQYGGFLYGIKGYEHHGDKISYKRFWFTIWKLLGTL